MRTTHNLGSTTQAEARSSKGQKKKNKAETRSCPMTGALKSVRRSHALDCEASSEPCMDIAVRMTVPMSQYIMKLDCVDTT